MRAERLVSMANDIGAFFDAEPDKGEAARAMVGHLTRFWDPRMRRALVTHYQQGGAGLGDLAKAAVALLASTPQ